MFDNKYLVIDINNMFVIMDHGYWVLSLSWRETNVWSYGSCGPTSILDFVTSCL